jgi:uncharacterized protein DUF397
MEFGHTQWRTSSFTDQTEACVEIAYPHDSPTVGIRDSKNPTGGHLTLPVAVLKHLIRTIAS